MSEISDCENTLYRAISDLESVHAKIRLDGDRIAQLETENAKLKQQLQAIALGERLCRYEEGEMSEDDVDNLIDWAEVGSLNYARSIVRKNAELEAENAKLKQQLQEWLDHG